MCNEIIDEGSDVLLFLDSKRTYLVKIEKGQDFHTHKGYIRFDEVIGRKYGQSVSSSLGYEFILFKPSLHDYMRKMRHATQIIYPKDIALIIFHSHIGCGSRIVEAGTGSGALTSALAHFVKPSGKVYSYEVRKEFLETAKKNLKRAGIFEYVELKNKDIVLGIDENEVDSVILDLATPWLVVPVAYEALKSGGKIVTFSPTIEQVVKTVNALEKNRFIDIETIENILRRIKVKAGKTRPETLMIGHTGYLTHARKTIK
ncbi:MAG: tRNA (adenine-N1)-methyltransferase [Candidatus Bathyarchaeota archaeon]|nr:MAG: tRNA (adenine-N1)-methyltransferase [Candidatus Bathyarchaeota archaeon]